MNYVLLLAGGTGKRLGDDTPKQYIKVKERPVIAYCLDTFASIGEIDGIWIVADSMWHDFVRPFAGKKFMGFSEPGRTRQLSIMNGLTDLREKVEESAAVVLIHDAARPLVSVEMIRACLEMCKEHDGVMPALPMKDTVYLADDGKITSLLERSCVVAGQAPEAFRMEKYYEANLALMPDRIKEISGSSQPAVLAGMDVVTIPGDERNFKITTRADLDHFCMMV